MVSILNNDLKMFVENEDDKIAVYFSKDFWLHKEAVETINVFMNEFVSRQPLTEALMGDVVKWFNNYLGLCFDTGLATTIYHPNFIKIEQKN
jgi:hypothetical protein